jgi:DNA-binding response OmpR family regulator
LIVTGSINPKIHTADKVIHIMPQKILIVDDEPNIVIPLQFLMEQNGYSTLVAQSGEEALESISKEKPDLVLLDIMLPGVDGFEVCEIVRLNPEWRKIRIIFLTAKGRDVDIAKGMVLGADEYITKPFSNQQIIDAVTKLLEEPA